MSENETVGSAESEAALALQYLREPQVGEPVRLLVVLAHPDDEVLALGGRMEWLRSSLFTTVTDGAPQNGADASAHGFSSVEAYKAARRAELLLALRDAGLSERNLLAFPTAVPDQQASLHLAPITLGVMNVLKSFRPQALFTHPYEGGHPDHDACAFAVHTAVALLGEPVPVLEAPFYHAGPLGEMQTGTFLGSPGGSAMVCPLSEQQQERKRARIACFASQAETLAQFGVERELYRSAPDYDFSKRPHDGQLLYERFDWGMHGERFCELAREAQRVLRKPENDVELPTTFVGVKR